MSEKDEKFMMIAIESAKNAAKNGETPVGAVIVKGDNVIAKAGNACEYFHDATCHAEMSAIREASEKLGFWRLSDCTLYVTMEPCPMCAGAIINSRIPRVVFGVKDPRAGAFGSLIDLSKYPLSSKPEVTSGVHEDECADILSDFFKNKR